MSLLEELRRMSPLSTFGEHTWVGRVVYHPMTQIGDTPYWRQLDVPADHPSKDFNLTFMESVEVVFDKGLVLDFHPDRDHPFDLSMCDVTFEGRGGRWTYRAGNLWTPAVQTRMFL